MVTFRALTGALGGRGSPGPAVHAMLMLCHATMTKVTYMQPPWKEYKVLFLHFFEPPSH